MTPDQGIIWLASYPKSGNTWFRIFLTHLLHDHKSELNFNQQTILGTGSAARFVMDDALGFNSALLTEEELSVVRPEIYNWHGQQPGVKYFKIHDAYYNPNNRQPIIPQETCLGVLYFIRNPLDVAISFAHHMNCSIDESINKMNYLYLSLKGSSTKSMSQVRQICSSWSWHVKSWTTSQEVKVLVMRYEDMHANTLATFSRALDFLQLHYSEERIRQALANSSFSQLKQQETQHGFRESAAPSRAFFRKGVVGDWEHTLSKTQIESIVRHHAPMMREFGYLDEQNKPISSVGDI